jgi:hypothetical protein
MPDEETLQREHQTDEDRQSLENLNYTCYELNEAELAPYIEEVSGVKSVVFLLRT